MNIILKIFLISFSSLFLLFVVGMVRKKHLELKYTLTWLAAAVVFVLIAVFDQIIPLLANLMSIKEPVNALFLIVFFFMLIILFTLSIAISKATERIRGLAQEIALLRKENEHE